MNTKEGFLKQKISNFIIFIEKKIGKDNKIYADFQNYLKDLNLFLQDIIQISQFTKTKDGQKYLEIDYIKKYLEFKEVRVNLSEEDFTKLNRYFNMFIKVVDN